MQTNEQSKKTLPKLISDQEAAITLNQTATEGISQEVPRSFKSHLVNLCNNPSGQGIVYLSQLMRTHSLPFEENINLREKFVPSFSKMEWKHAVQLWPQYKVQANIPEYKPVEPYIPRSFATEVFRAIKKAEIDTCQLSAADNKAKVVAWMRAILVEISNLFSGAVSNNAKSYIKGMGSSQGRIEFIYMVLDVCVIVVLEANVAELTSKNYAQMMAELEGRVVFLGLRWNKLHSLGCHCSFSFKGRAFQEQQEHSPSYNAWKEASSLAEAAKAKAFLAKEEQDFAVVRSLLNQSFDALPQDHKRPLRFPTQSNIIDECIGELQRSKT
ncbi:hypothetical protein PtB15_5B840 [Puccinia triticina]|nr:hypothetical protein PtB15_5B840 [Puccinia triticina]